MYNNNYYETWYIHDLLTCLLLDKAKLGILQVHFILSKQNNKSVHMLLCNTVFLQKKRFTTMLVFYLKVTGVEKSSKDRKNFIFNRNNIALGLAKTCH